jgi:hypothetical protein
MTRGWLADDLTAALDSVGASMEREHILALLRRSARIRLDGPVARGAANTVYAAIKSIEDTLDHIFLLEDRPLWIEMSHQERLGAAALIELVDPLQSSDLSPLDVGCLLAVDPDAAGHVAAVVAWRNRSGEIHHSYAVLHWDIGMFTKLAAAAQSQDAAGCEARLMELAEVSVPPGMADELEVWQEVSKEDAEATAQAYHQTKRDACGEHLFLLAALLMLNSSAVTLEVVVAADEADDVAPIWEAHLLPQGRQWPWQRRTGFIRPRFGGPLQWRNPVFPKVSSGKPAAKVDRLFQA